MNLNTPQHITPPPGIDDCDHLFTVSSRDGDTSLYARAQEFTFEGKTLYATALTLDSEEAHDVHDLPFPKYATSLTQAANWLVESAREQFGKGNFCQCSETRKTRSI